MANGKFDFKLLTSFATRSSLISSLKSLNVVKHSHAPRLKEYTGIENVHSHKDCDIITAALCEIKLKSVVVAWSQCIEGTGE